MPELKLPKARSDQAQAVVSRIDDVLQVVPPGTVDRRAFAVSVIAAANEIDFKKYPCTVRSVLMAAFNAARIGLEPGGVLGLCYFIPRRQNSVWNCHCEIGYQGFIDLAFRNSFLSDVDAVAVHHAEVESGDFKICVADGRKEIIHNINPSRPDTNRDNCAGAYCLYHTASGGRGNFWVPRHLVDKVDSNRNVWKTNYEAMVLKTPVRRAAKFWRKTPELAMAVRLEEQSESGMIQDIGLLPDEDKPVQFSLNDLPGDVGDDE